MRILVLMLIIAICGSGRVMVKASETHPKDKNPSKSCTTFRNKIDDYLSKKKIGRVLLISDLFNDAKDEFLSDKYKEDPGCVCVKLDGKSNSCGVILVSPKEKQGPSIYVVEVEQSPFVLKKVYEFNTYYGGKQNVFLLPKKKSVLENRGEGPDKISMPNDGIELINAGKSAFTIFIKNNKIEQVWTSD